MLETQERLRRMGFCVLTMLASLAAPAAAEVWVVAKHGVRDFDELQVAVAWAAEGDTIWIRGGEYGAVQVDGKGLHIVALDDGQAVIEKISIANLAVGQTVSLAGLKLSRIYPVTPGLETMLDIRSCDGSVRIQDCVIDGQGVAALVGLGVFESADVSVTGCTLIGPQGGRCVELAGSQVALFDCRISGRSSGTGLEVQDGKLLLHGCAVLGGHGDDSYECSPGAGGDGLVAHGTAEIYTVETEIVRGEGGMTFGISCPGLEGPPGQETVLGANASLVELAVAGRSWSCGNMVFGGDEIAFHYEGEPGDRLFVARAARSEFVWQLQNGGVRLISRPISAAPRIGTAVDGVLDVTLPSAKLQPPANESSFALQAYVIDGQGRLFWLGSGLITVLDAARVAPYRVPVHVDVSAAAGGDGKSWAGAFNDLQEALDVTRQSWESDLFLTREFWIAAGTYVAPPTLSSSDMGGFEVEFSVDMYGGFTGSESELDQRDFVANPTIFTGDQLGDDLPGFLNRTDNSSRVMTLHSPLAGGVLLDGFTLRGGHGGLPSDGAGLRAFSDGGDIHLRNCILSDNRGGAGAAAFLSGGTEEAPPEMLFESCDFIGNEAYGDGGGAIGISNNSPTGVMRSTLRLLNCRFLSNRAVGGNGGALQFWCLVSPALSITGCEFSGNEARKGGAMWIYLGSEPFVPVVNCTIRDNRGINGPGGIDLWDFALAPSPFKLRNSILWGNTRGGVHDEAAQISLGAGIALPHYSCIQFWSGTLGGVGNHGSNPLLFADGQLYPGSPAIDAGRNAVVPADLRDVDGDGDLSEPLPLDLAGNPRFVDDPAVPDSGVGPAPVVDMGAYERSP